MNYWFSNISTTMRSGTLVRLRRGGHVSINNLDVSGYRPQSESFVIDLPEVRDEGSPHSLSIRNARFEPLSEHARFLRCAGSAAWSASTTTTISSRAAPRGSPSNCAPAASTAARLRRLGRRSQPGRRAVSLRQLPLHRRASLPVPRHARGDDDNVQNLVQYQNCEFAGPEGDAFARNIHAFIRFSADGGGAARSGRTCASAPPCRLEARPPHVSDWDLGIQGPHASTSARTRHWLRLDPERPCCPAAATQCLMLPPAPGCCASPGFCRAATHPGGTPLTVSICSPAMPRLPADSARC